MQDIYALPEPIDGRIFGHNVDHLKEALKYITQAEFKKLQELEHFAAFFKESRIKYGFTQLDVGHALGRRYGTEFSQTTISRFEACGLTFKNMSKLQPILEQWIIEAEKAVLNGKPVNDIVEHGTTINMMGDKTSDFGLKKRKKRTNLDFEQTNVLEVVFRMNSQPTHGYLMKLAEELRLDVSVVKIWFCNRRQKMRRNNEVLERPDLNKLECVLSSDEPRKKRGRRPTRGIAQALTTSYSGASNSLDSSIFAESFTDRRSGGLTSQIAAHGDVEMDQQQPIIEKASENL